jgi:hypothetical protein
MIDLHSNKSKTRIEVRNANARGNSECVSRGETTSDSPWAVDVDRARVAGLGTETSNQGNFIEVLNLVVSAADIVKDVFF